MSKKKDNITKEEMELDFYTLICVFNKYAKDNDKNAENLKSLKKTLKRFKSLSLEGQELIIGKLIEKVETTRYSVAFRKCGEKGHRYTKWEEINWRDSHYSYEKFCEEYGAPKVWRRECKVCGRIFVDKNTPNSIRIAREKAARKARILELETELATLKKKDKK